jgi:hypothetical protein
VRGLAGATVLAVAVLVAGRAVGGQGESGRFIRFEDVAAEEGLDALHERGGTDERHLMEIMSGGGLFLDADGNGWPDVLLVDGGSLVDPAVRGAHRLYLNRGDGTFEDVSASAGLVHRAYGVGACAADVDNDGRTDVYVTSVGGNVLYRNQGDGRFADVTAGAGVAGDAFSASCAFADVDRDGDVDLYVVNYVDARIDNAVFCGDAGKGLRIYCHPLTFDPLQDVLYRNEGDGTFTDVTVEAGIAPHRGNGLGAVFGDYDDDGWVDLFVANDNTPNFLFHNDGDGTFSEVALLSGVAVASDGMPRAGMGTDFGDYDGDGDLDLFVTNHELEAHTLFRNLGDGLFEDVTFPSGVGRATLPFVGFGTGFLDLDNDRDLDLAIVNGHVMNSPEYFRPGATEAQANLVLRNDGRGRFEDVTGEAGAMILPGISRTLAAADIDSDGDLDVLVTNNGGAPELLRNSGARGGSVLLRLVGTRSNRDAIGARVRLTAGGVTQIREVRAGSSYLGQHELRVHVGLGAAAAIERLEIRWPSGLDEIVEGAAPGAALTITEGRGITGRAALAGR